MNYSTENDDYLMTTPYTKIQQKFEKVKSFLEQMVLILHQKFNARYS